MDRPRILVLGGGFAGVFAARALQRRLGDRADIELVSEHNYFVFQPLLPEVAGGTISAPHAVATTRILLKGVSVRKAVIDGIDFGRKRVTVFQGVQRRPTEIGYDHLVLALGQSTDLSRMPGMPEHALTMKTLECARRLRAHVIERLEHAEITQLPDVKRGALTFTVIGAGFSGIETVGEMKEMIDRSLQFYPNIDPSEVRVVVVEYANSVLGEMPETLQRYAHRTLETRGIEIKLGVGVASATGTSITLTNGETFCTRTIVATIGSAPSKLARGLDLTLQAGRIAVDRTLSTGRPDVWSIGDCALIPMKEGASERGDFAPPTAQFAVREARHVAANIAAVIEGKAPRPFGYTSKGAMASLGAYRGVADVMGVRLTGFPAWFLWRAYYVAALPGFGTRLGVLLNWTLDLLAARNVVQVHTDRPKAVRHALYRAGDPIFEQGNRSDGVYTVLEGAVQIERTDPETGEHYRRMLRAGEHFGARLIIGEMRRGTTARALEDTRVLILDRDELLMLAEGFDAVREHFARHIDEKLGIDWDPRGDQQPQRSAAE